MEVWIGGHEGLAVSKPLGTDEECLPFWEAKHWPRFFKMPVIMLMLITLLNDGTLISIGYDTAKPSHYPEKWNLPVLFVISSILGSVACGSSLLLLWAALDSWNTGSVFHRWGLGRMPYGKVITMVYLKVSADIWFINPVLGHNPWVMYDTPHVM
jgi:H+-transporting ATPase